MKLIVATKNAHKVAEFSRIFEPMGIEILSQTDVGIDIDVQEDADTFEGNARLKARAIYEKTGLPTIADDSGLEVHFLGNAPGVYSARYGGTECKTDKQRYEKVIKELDGVPKDERAAQFVCSISLILNNDKQYSFTGICKGWIGYEAIGENGFGYDPIFMIGDKSFSQLTDKQKDEISHRGNAVKQLQACLAQLKNEV